MTENGTNIHISSHNQSGGITAHTVNFGGQQRHMNAQLAKQLREMLPAAAHVTVVSVMGDSEAYQFAHEAKEYLVSAGYEVGGVDQAIFSGPVNGQGIKPLPDGKYELIIGANR